MRFPIACTFAVLLTACAADPGDDKCAAIPRKDSPGEAAEWFVAQRAIGDGELPVERYAPALAKKAAMTPAGAKLGRRAWTSVGPPTVGGRTRAIVIDPVDTNVLYATGASGGVWKSTDGAATWNSTGDAFANLATVTLVMDPSDRRTLYAGTGEGVYVNRPVTRSRGVRGDGIFVTNDAGGTWRQLAATGGNPDFDYVNKLVFDGNGRLFAATRAGVFVSSDRGETWTKRLTPPNGEGCPELAYVATRNRVIATCGVFSQSSIYTTGDAGATWQTIALPANSGRTTLAVAPSNADVVFALTAHAIDYNLVQLQRSLDGGATWSTVLDRSSPDLVSTLILSNPQASVNEQCEKSEFGALGQGWFDNVIAVDPKNPDIMFVGGVDLFRSDDGGKTFRIASRWWVDGDPSYVHADQHAIVFDPKYDGVSNRRMWVGNDGGVYRTEDARGVTSPSICAQSGGLAWTQRNQGYGVTQFYHGVVSADGKTLVAGAQDNGTQLGDLSSATPLGAWRELYGGDGAYAALDPRDPKRIYASAQGASFNRTDDSGVNFTSIRNGLPPQGSNYQFIHPLIVDPNNPDVLWTAAGPRIYRSVDRGANWVVLTPSPIAANTAKLGAIDVFAGDSKRIVAGFDDGTVAVSSDGATFKSVVPRVGVVSSVAFDPADAQRIHVTYSTFGGTHVFVSNDGGATYQALDGETPQFALPDVPAHVLRVDPRSRDSLMLGTDIGLFVSKDGGKRWVADASGLGNVLVEQLVVAGTGADRALYAFTYGRGAFRAKLSDLDAPAANPGYAGAWFEPASVGQGMQLEVMPAIGQLAVGWYTFGEGVSASNHVWLIGSGNLVGDVATVPLFRVERGRFGGSPASATLPAGELVIRFADCSSATATYSTNATSGAGGRTGEIALQRIGSPRVCDAFRAEGDGALSSLATKSAAGTFELGHSGSWLSADAVSQGFVLDIDPATSLAIASWYTFDPVDTNASGEAATWFTAQGSINGAVATLDVYRTLGGAFDAGGGTTTKKVGTLTLTAKSCTAMDAVYDVTARDGSRRNGTFALARVAPPTLCEAMAP